MTHDAETDRLISEMQALPAYRGWCFSYEYPGYFCYSHPGLPHSVFFTPDWEGEESLPIEVQDTEGHSYEEHSSRIPLSREGRTAEKLLDLVRPTLDKLLALPAAPVQPGIPATIELHVHLTPYEVEALQVVGDHLMLSHTAKEYSRVLRDVLLGAIGKVIAAARKACDSPSEEIR